MRFGVVTLLLMVCACGGADDVDGLDRAESTTTTAATPTSAADPSPTASAARPLPDRSTLTQADTGATFSTTLGNRIELHLANDWTWSGPFLVGPAELVQIDFIQDPGYRAWEVLMFEPGIVAITSRGEPNCGDATQCPALDYSVAIEVEADG